MMLYIENPKGKSGSEKGELKIGQKHFEEAFKKVKSSISKEVSNV